MQACRPMHGPCMAHATWEGGPRGLHCQVHASSWWIADAWCRDKQLRQGGAGCLYSCLRRCLRSLIQPLTPSSKARCCHSRSSIRSSSRAGREGRRRKRRRMKSEGEKGGIPQNAEKGTRNDGEAMLISGHHAAGSQALRRGRKWPKSDSDNLNVQRIGT